MKQKTYLYNAADIVKRFATAENPTVAFKMSDHAEYAISSEGAFVRVGKDIRSVKERNRARRQSRK